MNEFFEAILGILSGIFCLALFFYAVNFFGAVFRKGFGKLELTRAGVYCHFFGRSSVHMPREYFQYAEVIGPFNIRMFDLFTIKSIDRFSSRYLFIKTSHMYNYIFSPEDPEAVIRELGLPQKKIKLRTPTR